MSSILHVSYLPNGSFVLPIISRLQGSTKPHVRELAKKWSTTALSLLGASLSTKVTMLGLLATRYYARLIPLQTELAQRKDLDEHLRRGAAWTPAQRALPYELLIELDSFVFEFRSAYEILGKFLRAFSQEILAKPITETDLLKVLSDRGIDTAWARELQERRKFLFHEHAPWLAYRVNKTNPLDSELIFLAHADADATNPEESISQRTLGSIYAGFESALTELQAWAVRDIGKLEE